MRLTDAEKAIQMLRRLEKRVDSLEKGINEILRDEFAGRAMQSIISKPQASKLTLSELAGVSYEYADAMMEARNDQ